MEINYSAHLQKAFFFTALSGIVMITCLFVYLGVVEYITRTVIPFTGFADVQDMSFLRIVLLTVSAFLMVCIGIIKKRLIAREPGPGTMHRRAPWFSSAIRRLVVASVLSFIFSELIALCGLTLFFLVGNASNYYIFMALSLVSFLIHFPRYRQWERCVAEPSRKGFGAGA